MKAVSLLAGCLLLLGWLLLGCESGNTPPELPQEGQQVLILRQYRGQQGPFPDRAFMVVQRPEVWQALWEPRDAPVVDFSTETALVALMGQQPTAGYDIRITDVRDPGPMVNVRVFESLPNPDLLAAQVITYPYDIVIVSKISKPVNFVVDSVPTQPVTILDGFIGQYSDVVSPKTAVIRDQLAWERFWTESFGERFATPPIDFSRNMAVAVFAGQKPTGGYSVFIPLVKRTEDRLVVFYRLTAPAPGSVVTQAVTSPFAIAIIPTSPQAVTFTAITTPTITPAPTQ